jgi:hypothetical protein
VFLATPRRCEQCQHGLKDRRTPSTESRSTRAAKSGDYEESVHEAKADFRIEFEDGSRATFCLANPGSSVVGTRQEQCSRISRVNLAPFIRLKSCYSDVLLI